MNNKFIRLRILKLPEIEEEIEEEESVVGFSDKQKSKPKKKRKHKKAEAEVIPIILPIDCITGVALVDNKVWLDTLDNKTFQLVDDFNYIAKRLKAK